LPGRAWYGWHYHRGVREVRDGIWHWEAHHPDWTPAAGGWGPEVSSYAIDDGERLVVFDPIAPPGLLDELASGRGTAIVLTCTWHARDAQSLAKRLGAPIYLPPREEADPDPLHGHVFRPGDRLPVGVEVFPGMESNDLVLWVESRGALVVGDTLIDRGDGLEFPRDWVGEGRSPDEILDSLRPLLRLPVELVLPTHGAPGDRAALERALA
jgi:glyoxylase-like metal-dependent hydrolase (beta-lactamase superfamily II)